MGHNALILTLFPNKTVLKVLASHLVNYRLLAVRELIDLTAGH